MKYPKTINEFLAISQATWLPVLEKLRHIMLAAQLEETIENYPPYQIGNRIE